MHSGKSIPSNFHREYMRQKSNRRGYAKDVYQTNRDRDRDYGERSSAPSKSLNKWHCRKCNFVNNSQNTICGGIHGLLGCKTPRPKGQLQAKSEWFCQCGFRNTFLNPVCGGIGGHLGCGMKRPEATTWQCKDCFTHNPRSSEICQGAHCNSKRPLANWRCPNCQFVNRNTNYICGGSGGRLGCKFPRPSNPTSIDVKSVFGRANQNHSERENVKVLAPVYISALRPSTLPALQAAFINQSKNPMNVLQMSKQ